MDLQCAGAIVLSFTSLRYPRPSVRLLELYPTDWTLRVMRGAGGDGKMDDAGLAEWFSGLKGRVLGSDS